MVPTLVGAATMFALAAYERLIWPQVAGCVLAGLVATSLVAVLRPIKFTVDVETPARVTVGEPFRMTLRIGNRGGPSRRSVVVRHRWRARRALVAELIGFVDVVPADGDAVVRARRLPTVRGAAEIAEIEFEVAGPFGFFTRIASHSMPQEMLVLPAPAPALPYAIGPGRQVGAMAGGRTADADVRGVRDWRAGDRISQVHWRSVVRTGRMTVLERDGRSAGSLVVLLLAPAQRRRVGRDGGFESAISAVAATAIVALRRGTPVCVVAQAKGQAPGMGFRHPGDEQSLLECFARVDIAQEPSDGLLEHALSHATQGGVVLVVAAKATPPAWRTRVFDATAAVGAVAIDVVDRAGADRPAPVPS